MRATVDETHADLKQVLAELMSADIDITAREIARRHPSLKNASAFTRHVERRNLIEEARRAQVSARAVQMGPVVQKAATLSEQLALKSARVLELEQQVGILVASHAACVRAVMKHGGIQSLQRFWREYEAISDGLRSLDAIPGGAEVKSINLQKAGSVDKI